MSIIGYNAHEFIIDFAEYKEACGVDAIDAAKRLQDFGALSEYVGTDFPVHVSCL